MGLFDFLGKKEKKKDEQARLVTEAVDPSRISGEKKDDDLKKLEAFNKKLSQSNQNSNLAQEVKPKTQEEESLEIKNPFIGK